MHKFTFTLAAALILSGCAMGPDYQAPTNDIPSTWNEQQQAIFTNAANESAANTEAWEQWWLQYQDPSLNRLVERALDSNLSLQIQMRRIEQARGQLGLSRANQWPLLSAQASAAREQQPTTVMPAELGGGAPSNQFSIAGALSYEVDLWGRISRQREAAAAMLEESIFGTEAIRLNLITDVISTYFSLVSIEEQRQTALEMISSLEQTLEIEQYRNERGASSPLNVRRAQASLASARATLPDLEEAAQTTRSALAILVGYSPREILTAIEFDASEQNEIQPALAFPNVAPSELLQRRPDLRAAEANLKAASAEVGVAVAERFPSLNLNAMFGTGAMDTGDLFSSDAESWSLGADLAGPLFDFGRRRIAVETAEVALEIAELEYQQAILSAFQDARDALQLLTIAEQRLAAIEAQHEAIADTYRLAQLQYDGGAIGLFELLETQRALLDASMALTDARNGQLTASTNLFKALGGGW
ncbi:RND transporter [Aliidiomarina iranensis]|uniref:RND transporter n=1 Tax=Aliidiomarina iranensis TaxID=1434071 RepID=A0A432VZW7_9GAMM|nr:efflux transporter outer membrane subunit [Aliidiomarina iranensis]RUO22273.1 RND transporter [Aliidiomarina iranensis]